MLIIVSTGFPFGMRSPKAYNGEGLRVGRCFNTNVCEGFRTRVGRSMEFPPFFIIFVAAVLLFLLIATASQHRRYSSQTQNKLCRGCGASHPGYAAFCRRCGRKL